MFLRGESNCYECCQLLGRLTSNHQLSELVRRLIFDIYLSGTQSD
jgi:hypothetical protein